MKDELDREVDKKYKEKIQSVNKSTKKDDDDYDDDDFDEDKIRGAAIDVFKVEPYEGPLLGIRKLITTPHIASSSKGVRFLMEEESCINLVGYFKDE